MTVMLRFWLNKHKEFNTVCQALNECMSSVKNDATDSNLFRANIKPKVDWLIINFNEHHHIEDHFVFPALRGLAPALKPQFDRLDSDHSLLNTNLEKLAGISKQYIHSEDSMSLTKLNTEFTTALIQLTRKLQEHLSDEEDLVVPLFLEYGENRILG